MAGTKEGGRKAKMTNLAKHGEDFYARIGRKGGKLGTTGGFASEAVGADGLTGPERAKKAGAKGGHISKRGKAKNHAKQYHLASEVEDDPQRQESIRKHFDMFGWLKKK